MIIENGTKLDFDIYRKPTFTGRFITSDSFHNFRHKMASFHSMAHRLVSIPLTEARYQKKRNYIIELGKINGYANDTIDRVAETEKHERKARLTETTTLSQTRDTEEIKRVSVPFDPTVHK